MSSTEKNPSGGPVCQVEKMTATSTTSPKTDPSTDLESQREIQNALDKKRKRKSVHVKDSVVKHIKLDCSINSKINQYIEAKKELETTHRISQDLPNCNWLEQKIKLSETQKSNHNETSRQNNLFGSDSEDENLVVDDLLVVEDGNRLIDETAAAAQQKTNVKIMTETDTQERTHPPCISIAETEGSQPIEIEFHIKSVDADTYPLHQLMKKTDSPVKKVRTEAIEEVKSDLRNYRPQNYSERKRSFHQENKVDGSDGKVHENLKECDNKIKELISAKHDLEKDIDALKNQKIHEMIQLLDIKTSKEKYMTELEGIRSEIAKEKSVLASLKQQNCSVASPVLDLSSSGSAPVTGSSTGSSTGSATGSVTGSATGSTTGSFTRSGSATGSLTADTAEQQDCQPRYGGERESSIPSLAPSVRNQTKPREIRQQPRPDYYRQMFDPAAAKVPRLSEGKNRELSGGMFGGGLPSGLPAPSHHPHHHPPMMHYMGHHNQPVNLSRAMESDIVEKARIPQPSVSLQQIQPIYKVGPQHETPRPATAPTPYSLHGPLPPITKPSDFFLAAARQEHLYQSKRGGPGQQMMVPLLPPSTLEPESKCESCGSQANFMCSACKLVHYCSAQCQVSHYCSQ